MPPQGASKPSDWASGVSFGCSAHQIGEVPVFALSFLGSSFLFSKAGAGGPFSRCKQMPTCPHPPLAPSTKQGAVLYSRELLAWP